MKINRQKLGRKPEQSLPSELGTRLSTRGSCVRIPLRIPLKGSQCHPPLQGGTCCGEMDDISLPRGWSCIDQDRGLIKKDENQETEKTMDEFLLKNNYNLKRTGTNY